MSNDSGKLGEDLACRYLLKRKNRILKRNFRTRLGEIDIVALDGKALVFVEVKYGSRDAYLRVNRLKFKRISIAAQEFLRDFGDFGSERYRVDVLSIDKDGTVTHFKDVATDFER